MRIEDNKWLHGLFLGNLDVKGDALQGVVFRLTGQRNGLAVLCECLRVHAFDAGPGENIMELVKQHALPWLF